MEVSTNSFYHTASDLRLSMLLKGLAKDFTTTEQPHGLFAYCSLSRLFCSRY
eukprot:SAG31_NODE_30_length_32545_cov_9.378999_21_plen_52_part_00